MVIYGLQVVHFFWLSRYYFKVMVALPTNESSIHIQKHCFIQAIIGKTELNESED